MISAAAGEITPSLSKGMIVSFIRGGPEYDLNRVLTRKGVQLVKGGARTLQIIRDGIVISGLKLKYPQDFLPSDEVLTNEVERKTQEAAREIEHQARETEQKVQETVREAERTAREGALIARESAHMAREIAGYSNHFHGIFRVYQHM
ncbi:MAG: hypothetical protein Hyperionvirus4_121 [Hyperionvirus sp.]|uniref:Uncharacterized protein n=1 Tax=Hyperionvirus sp. TaxID=2487770 RepID=A0A3G5A7C6_9VIRU|nr:MAG: hypothetical protein Hyperionvirus4_121 [Hyperionvirus sp.]